MGASMLIITEDTLRKKLPTHIIIYGETKQFNTKSSIMKD
jgi:hypothetical protein